MVNNKGQTLGMVILFAIIIFAFGVLFLNIFLPDVASARTDLDCSNTAISDGNKLACLFVDIAVPYYIWGILSLAGGIALSRFL